MAAPELFHRLDEPASAAARRRAVELGLVGRVDFRNVAFEEHGAALRALGGAATPALWDGKTLHVGQGPVIAALERL
jgi:hypothetical protein